MAKEIRVNVISQDGSSDLDPDVFDEYEPMKMQWQEPGMVYRWCDKDSRVLPTRVRQGWKVCDIEEDFLRLKCPSGSLPGVPQPGGEIHFGDSILCKMPIALAAKRYSNTIAKAQVKRSAGIDSARREGESVAREIRGRGLDVGSTIITEVSEEERERDWKSDPNKRVHARDGEHVYGDPSSRGDK